jgi:hypothetical protein
MKFLSHLEMVKMRPNDDDPDLIRPSEPLDRAARTNHWKDTDQPGHSGIESQTKSTGAA